MDEELVDFAKAYEKQLYARNGFTKYKEQWYSWNYWAQHHGNFSVKQWLNENNLEFEDIQAKTNFPQANIVRNREEGFKYFSAWRGAKQAVDDTEKLFDELFEMLWKKKNLDGTNTYSNEELGRAIGRDGESLRRFAAKKTWYEPRGRKGRHVR